MPRPPATADRPMPRRGGRAGQTLIVFALASLALLGIVGLVVDGGMEYAARRQMQNAADAAALAGAKEIYNGSTAAVVWSRVQAVAQQNNATDSARLTCRYVDNGENDLGPCNVGVIGTLLPPLLASGVVVGVGESHQTIALRALGIAQSQAGAQATAHVQSADLSQYDLGSGPFIVCGYLTDLANGGSLSILLTDATGQAILNNGLGQINPAAIGQTFKIHGPQISTCDTQGNRFKGDNDQDANTGRTIASGGTGATINYQPGVRAGPMRQAVNAVNGCGTNASTAGQCLMILPIADNVDVDSGNCQCIHVVAFGTFLVSDPTANTDNATLVSNVLLYGPSKQTWTYGSRAPATVRLTR